MCYTVFNPKETMQNLILFDVDGTLTESRRPIKTKMLKALRALARRAEIGFLTGSGLDYIKEQLWPALNDPIIKKNCHLLPCNGTEYLITDGDEEIIFNEISKACMEDEIGSEEQQKLMKILCKLQSEICTEYSIPLTGNFIQNRFSMINWCPIGRSANQTQRSTFVTLDKESHIREIYMDRLKEYLTEKDIDITVKFGGDTSFDIYPNGWDKTYALRHFAGGEWNFWFVGDRCYENGNDYEIFEYLKETGRAFETGGPEETIEIIDFHILRDLF
jgi:phosphomannomutase